MGESFFTRFKKTLKANYDGRYLAVILQEVITDEPRLISILFPTIKVSSKDIIQIKIESHFVKHRRADMDIRINGKEAGLLEIKYNDKALVGQLEAYIKYCKKNELNFSYLTLNPLDLNEKKIIDLDKNGSFKINHILYNTLYKKIKEKKLDKNPVVNLFCKFLEENFMIYDQSYINKNEDVLIFIMLKTLFVKHAHGFGRKVSEKNINGVPDFWSRLIGNIRVLGDRFYDDFGEFFSIRPSINYNFQPEFNISNTLRELKNNKNSEDCIERERRTGGYFNIWYSSSFNQIKKSDHISIHCGISFYLNLESKEIEKFLFAEITGKKIQKNNNEHFINVRSIPNENMAYKQLLKCSLETISNCLTDENNKEAFQISPEYKKQLNKIYKKIKNFIE